MSDQQNSNRVVNLSEYRAARAALRAQVAAPVPYLLWYPGVGYVQVNPATSAAGPFGLPAGKTRPGY
jgi:hypothetical protein